MAPKKKKSARQSGNDADIFEKINAVFEKEAPKADDLIAAIGDSQTSRVFQHAICCVIQESVVASGGRFDSYYYLDFLKALKDKFGELPGFKKCKIAIGPFLNDEGAIDKLVDIFGFSALFLDEDQIYGFDKKNGAYKVKPHSSVLKFKCAIEAVIDGGFSGADIALQKMQKSDFDSIKNNKPLCKKLVDYLLRQDLDLAFGVFVENGIVDEKYVLNNKSELGEKCTKIAAQKFQNIVFSADVIRGTLEDQSAFIAKSYEEATEIFGKAFANLREVETLGVEKIAKLLKLVFLFDQKRFKEGEELFCDKIEEKLGRPFLHLFLESNLLLRALLGAFEGLKVSGYENDEKLGYFRKLVEKLDHEGNNIFHKFGQNQKAIEKQGPCHNLDNPVFKLFKIIFRISPDSLASVNNEGHTAISCLNKSLWELATYMIATSAYFIENEHEDAVAVLSDYCDRLMKAQNPRNEDIVLCVYFLFANGLVIDEETFSRIFPSDIVKYGEVEKSAQGIGKLEKSKDDVVIFKSKFANMINSLCTGHKYIDSEGKNILHQLVSLISDYSRNEYRYLNHDEIARGVRLYKIVERGVNINQRNNKGDTPAHLALGYGLGLGIIKDLVTDDFNIEVKGEQKQDLFQLAVSKERVDVAEFLLKKFKKKIKNFDYISPRYEALKLTQEMDSFVELFEEFELVDGDTIAGLQDSQEEGSLSHKKPASKIYEEIFVMAHSGAKSFRYEFPKNLDQETYQKFVLMAFEGLSKPVSEENLEIFYAALDKSIFYNEKIKLDEVKINNEPILIAIFNNVLLLRECLMCWVEGFCNGNESSVKALSCKNDEGKNLARLIASEWSVYDKNYSDIDARYQVKEILKDIAQFAVLTFLEKDNQGISAIQGATDDMFELMIEVAIENKFKERSQDFTAFFNELRQEIGKRDKWDKFFEKLATSGDDLNSNIFALIEDVDFDGKSILEKLISNKSVNLGVVQALVETREINLRGAKCQDGSTFFAKIYNQSLLQYFIEQGVKAVQFDEDGKVITKASDLIMGRGFSEEVVEELKDLEDQQIKAEKKRIADKKKKRRQKANKNPATSLAKKIMKEVLNEVASRQAKALEVAKQSIESGLKEVVENLKETQSLEVEPEKDGVKGVSRAQDGGDFSGHKVSDVVDDGSFRGGVELLEKVKDPSKSIPNQDYSKNPLSKNDSPQKVAILPEPNSAQYPRAHLPQNNSTQKAEVPDLPSGDAATAKKASADLGGIGGLVSKTNVGEILPKTKVETYEGKAPTNAGKPKSPDSKDQSIVNKLEKKLATKRRTVEKLRKESKALNDKITELERQIIQLKNNFKKENKAINQGFESQESKITDLKTVISSRNKSIKDFSKTIERLNQEKLELEKGLAEALKEKDREKDITDIALTEILRLKSRIESLVKEKLESEKDFVNALKENSKKEGALDVASREMLGLESKVLGLESELEYNESLIEGLKKQINELSKEVGRPASLNTGLTAQNQKFETLFDDNHELTQRVKGLKFDLSQSQRKNNYLQEFLFFSVNIGANNQKALGEKIEEYKKMTRQDQEFKEIFITDKNKEKDIAFFEENELSGLEALLLSSFNLGDGDKTIIDLVFERGNKYLTQFFMQKCGNSIKKIENNLLQMGLTETFGRVVDYRNKKNEWLDSAIVDAKVAQGGPSTQSSREDSRPNAAVPVNSATTATGLLGYGPSGRGNF